MRRTAMFLGALLLVASTARAGADEDAIKKRFETEFTAAWAKDAKTLAAFWTDDGTLINPIGKQAKGRAEVEKLINEDLNTVLKGGKFKFTVHSIHMIKPDVAVVDAMHEADGVKMPDGKMGKATFPVVFVTVKKDNQWWTTDARPHVYLPAPPAAGKKAS